MEKTPALRAVGLKNEHLLAKVEHLEQEKETLEVALGDLSDKLEKAKLTTTEILKEKHDILKAKENSDRMHNKNLSDLEIFKTKVKTLSREKEKHEMEEKLAKKTIKSKEKEIFSLSTKNENLSDNLKRQKSEICTLKKESKNLLKEKESLIKTL